jgi:hypothetical protein
MKIIDWIKKNPISIIITSLFIIILIYLISTGLMSDRTMGFYDVLSESSVSDQYTSTLPAVRYFIEPLVGLTFVLCFNNNPLDIIFIFITFYLVLRIVLSIIDRVLLKNNKKKKIYLVYIKDVLNFTAKYGSLILVILAGFLLIGYLRMGFLFVANFFEIVFHLGSWVGFFLFIGKIIYNVIIFYLPNRSLKIKGSKQYKSKFMKIFGFIKREGIYFLTSFLILFSFNFTLLSIRFPTYQITANDLESNEFLFDFHVHTTMSDGHLTPEQRVLWYIQHGIHGAGFSDHHNTWGAKRAIKFVEANNLDFTVLMAQEFTDDPENLHLNVFGIDEDLTPEGYTQGPYSPNEMNCSEMIKWVKENSGWVIVNHYYASDDDDIPFSYEELRDWGVDGFEIANGGNYDARYQEIREFCLNNSLICLAGSDMHANRELNTFVRFKLNNPSNKSVDNIFNHLQNNTHECVVISGSDYYYDYSRSDPFSGIPALNNYFLNLDIFQTLSWIIWLSGIYTLMILLLRRIKKSEFDEIKSKISEKKFKK